MNDLISRQAAKDAFMKATADGDKVEFCWWVLDAVPTIDPVKHGKWIVIPQRCENQTFDECKCSVCGTVEYFNSGWKKFIYCPNCGARMEWRIRIISELIDFMFSIMNEQKRTGEI